MEALERQNATRIANGVQPLRLHQSWVNRPRLNDAEHALWIEFQKFARFCGGDPRPPDAQAWFEMRDVSHAERWWLAEVFGAMAAVGRERVSDD